MRISDWSSDVCSSDLVACARCHRAATLRHRVAELRHHCSRAATQRGSNSGDLDEEKAGENVERDDPDTGAPDVVKIAIECCCCGFSDIGHNQHKKHRT